MVEGTQRRLSAIVSADVVGYSRLMGVDETGTLAALRAHRTELIDPKIAEHGGRIVKTMGDGLLLEFPSVVNATQCVIEVQLGMAERNERVDDNRRIEFRIGVNLGDIIIEGEDIHGDGVNIAARLQGIAERGGVSISGRVHDDVRDRLDEVFEDTGEQTLKNIARPVPVWRWSSAATSTPAASKINVEEGLPLPDKPSIIVLPFNNMSGDPDQGYFADGITEDITTELSRFSELFVIARNTAFTYKEQTFDIKNIAHEMGVQFVLEGSVQKAGNRVRINAQLIEGQNISHLWAERYDGMIEEIFDLQDQVTHQVVSAIVPHINDAERARVQRGERIFDEAHDLAWQAMDEWVQSYGKSDHSAGLKARAKAYRAIEKNERCLKAYTMICISIWQEVLMQWSDNVEESLAELKRVAETYVFLAPNSHMAHFCHGVANMMHRHAESAAQDFRFSVELNGNDANVLSMLALVEVQQLGNLDDAKEIAARAIRLNPKDFRIGTAYLALALVAFVEGDGEFRHWAEKAILAQPSAPIRRALMIAHAADIGDPILITKHRDHLNKIAPRFLPKFLSSERRMYRTPEYQEKFLKLFQAANLSE